MHMFRPVRKVAAPGAKSAVSDYIFSVLHQQAANSALLIHLHLNQWRQRVVNIRGTFPVNCARLVQGIYNFYDALLR